jgi:hypothetical protein
MLDKVSPERCGFDDDVGTAESPDPPLPSPPPRTPIAPLPSLIHASAVAAATSSASKLRQSRLQFRPLHPNQRRRTPPSKILIGRDSPPLPVAIAPPPPPPPAASSTAAAAALESAWKKAIEQRADDLFKTFWYSVRHHQYEYVQNEQRILTNVQLHVKCARKLGCDPPHAPSGCPGPFHPSTFFDQMEFAHHDEYKVKKIVDEQCIVNQRPRRTFV